MITESEWQAIPEIGDYTIKNKKRMQVGAQGSRLYFLPVREL